MGCRTSFLESFGLSKSFRFLELRKNPSSIFWAERQGKGQMEYKVLATVFATVFIAELGDKTQLATMLFAADKEVSKLTVFIGASLALIAASGFGVLAGGIISQYVSERHLHYIAGAGFIAIGIWTLVKA